MKKVENIQHREISTLIKINIMAQRGSNWFDFPALQRGWQLVDANELRRTVIELELN